MVAHFVRMSNNKLYRNILKFGKEETWVKIDDRYSISSHGNIFDSVKNKNSKQYNHSRGYKTVKLHVNGNIKTLYVHRLVAKYFLGLDEKSKLVVNHIKMDKTFNMVWNLEIVTQKENANMKHKKTSSIYTGVSWDKRLKKWRAQIQVGQGKGRAKSFSLGTFEIEYEAHLEYERCSEFVRQNGTINGYDFRHNKRKRKS